MPPYVGKSATPLHVGSMANAALAVKLHNVGIITAQPCFGTFYASLHPLLFWVNLFNSLFAYCLWKQKIYVAASWNKE